MRPGWKMAVKFHPFLPGCATAGILCLQHDIYFRLEVVRANHKLATSATPKPPKQPPEFWENIRNEKAEVNILREMLRSKVLIKLKRTCALHI